MTKFKVAIIVGSLRKDSMNLKLAKALAKLGQDKFEAKFLQIGDLPLFNQDLEANFPESATRLKNDIAASDAVLFVTPEYNRGMPGPLKNALDWCSRPYGKNSFTKKPGAICGASVGAIGTACSQNSLKPILNYLDIILMGQPELYLHFTDGLIDDEGNVTNENTKKFLQKFVDAFDAWLKQHVKK
ncbi:MAG: NADPH-dependent reductase family protein [Rickettsiaceae bacterium]|jgi:chromate reductase|nr:NADPH-dependent reductase family protein [Rickettsiaceae bacterium]